MRIIAGRMEHIRNIGIAAHIDAGKTTTTERILYLTGRIYRMGEVDEGTATMDWMELEKERGITITSAATYCCWKNHNIHIIDTPGHVDFTIEVERALRVLDGAVVLLSGVEGVQSQTETVWKQADRYRVPRILFVNKMDRPGANFFRTIESAEEKFRIRILPLQLPIGEASEFKGIIDVLQNQVIWWKNDSCTEWEIGEILPEYQDDVCKHRQRIEEVLAEMDDEVAELYLSGKPAPVHLLKKVLRKGVIQFRLVPAFCGSALKNKGVHQLLDAIIDYLPSPLDLPPVEGWHPKTQEKLSRIHSIDAPLTAYAFKVATDPFVGRLVYVRIYSGKLQKGKLVLNATRGCRERIGRVLRMHSNYREDVEELSAGELGAIVGVKNTFTGDSLCLLEHPIVLEALYVPEAVVSVAIEPRSQQDQDRLARALKKLAEEDPTFHIQFQEETGQTILSGMGELHLEIITSRLLREFQVGARIGRPEVAYKETIAMPVEVEGRYVRQSGGRGHFGVVRVRLEPISPTEGFQFENRIREGRIPSEFIPAVEQGMKEALASAGVFGYPLIGVKAILLDGAYHEVDSSDIAFKIAGVMALREGVRKANPVLLEPMMKLEVVIPPGSLGSVLSDLQSHRGQVAGLQIYGDGLQVVQAIVPLAEMFGYAGRLRTLTQGKGSFTMEFYRYEPKQTNHLLKEEEQVLVHK